MAETMIERVAREMFRRRRKDQGVAYFGGQDEVETDWLTVKSLYIADALAVIAVMRDPSNEIVQAGFDAEAAANPHKTQPHHVVPAVWAAMIDAALAEEG